MGSGAAVRKESYTAGFVLAASSTSPVVQPNCTAVRALARTVATATGRAPSIRNMTTGCLPASTTAMAVGTPISAAACRAASTISRAVSSSIRPPSANRFLHEREDRFGETFGILVGQEYAAVDVEQFGVGEGTGQLFDHPGSDERIVPTREDEYRLRNEG